MTAGVGHDRDQTGSTVVEAVILVPVLLVLVLLAVQMAIWAEAAWAAQTAAIDGQRAASTAGTTQAGAAAATSVLSSSGSVRSFAGPQVRFDPSGTVGVSVHADAWTVLPWIHLPVAADRRGPLQRFRVFP